MFGQKLYRLRNEKGLSQKELGKKLGISDSVIDMLEKNETVVSIDIAIAVAEYFDVTLDYLAGDTNVPDIHKNIEMFERLNSTCRGREILEFTKKAEDNNISIMTLKLITILFKEFEENFEYVKITD